MSSNISCGCNLCPSIASSGGKNPFQAARRSLRCCWKTLAVASAVQLPLDSWWPIPLSKWDITPIISGLTLLIPFITGVITHLLSGMSHQAATGLDGLRWLQALGSILAIRRVGPRFQSPPFTATRRSARCLWDLKFWG